MSDKERIIDTIAKTFKKDAGELSDGTRMKEDLNAKSGDYFGVIAVMEEMTGKKVTYAQLRKRKTLGEIVSFVAELKTQ